MYLSEIKIKNFRCFDDREHIIRFHSSLNILVGENDSGKSAVIDAIRIVLGTTDQGWYRIDSSDFYNEDNAREICIICHFEDLNDNESAAFLECLTYEDNGTGNKPNLYLNWHCKYLHNFTPARTSVSVFSGICGDGPNPAVEAKELLRVTYLRALRDAYNDMQASRNSRLSQIIQSIPNINNGVQEYSEGMHLSELSIAGIADLSNKLLAEHKTLKETNQSVTDILNNQMLLHGDSLQTQLQVAGMNSIESKKFVSLLEKLDLAALSADGKSHGRVGLGTSNIMSMACEMLLNTTNTENGRSSFLLIEEPEAHIHAQRQLRLIQSLQNEASEHSHQIIITTHSPLLASTVDLNNITIMNKMKAFSLAKGQTLLSNEDYAFLSRYLDATKANLFFAKAVLIVEGPAEELLLPTIAQIIGRDFAKYGVSIVNVRGIGLRRFARIFQQTESTNMLPIPVACVTDRDIMPDCAPAICIDEKYISISDYPPKKRRKWKTESEFAGSDDIKSYVDNIKQKADGQNVKTFVSEYWTLEYDMFYVGIQNEMLEAMINSKDKDSTHKENICAKVKSRIEQYQSQEEKSSYFYSFFYKGLVSKAEFAQTLASILLSKYYNKPDDLISQLPSYIIDAISYVTEDVRSR